jgi:hypothetical protein
MSCIVSYKLGDVSEMRTASIIVLVMEAVSAYETSVSYSTTWLNVPEGCHLTSFYCFSYIRRKFGNKTPN